MIECPHGIYFFRGAITNFGFIDDYKGEKSAAELTEHPNPLLVAENEGDCFRATEQFITTSDYVVGAGKTIKVGTYICVSRIKLNDGTYIFKFDNFGDKVAHTLRDWCIAPLGRPVVSPPQQKLHIVNIPGANGVLDLSNSLTKYPVFDNRTGDLKFAILNDFTDTPTSYTKMLRFLQGTDVKMVLEDDPLYYYEGRVFVNGIDPRADGNCSEVTLGYDLYPYRRSIYTSVDDWLWDAFNFETDVIQQTMFDALQVDTITPKPIGEYHNDRFKYYVDPDGIRWLEVDFTDFVDMMPVNPEFIVDTVDNKPMPAQLWNSDLLTGWKKFNLKETSDPKARVYNGLIFCEFTEESQVKMRFRGKGTVTIKFRSGRL